MSPSHPDVGRPGPRGRGRSCRSLGHKAPTAAGVSPQPSPTLVDPLPPPGVGSGAQGGRRYLQAWGWLSAGRSGRPRVEPGPGGDGGVGTKPPGAGALRGGSGPVLASPRGSGGSRRVRDRLESLHMFVAETGRGLRGPSLSPSSPRVQAAVVVSMETGHVLCRQATGSRCSSEAAAGRHKGTVASEVARGTCD